MNEIIINQKNSILVSCGGECPSFFLYGYSKMESMNLIDKMKGRVMQLHSKQQLNHKVTKTWRSTDHFTQYLVNRYTVHTQLDPVIKVSGLDTTIRLSHDLQSLDLDWAATYNRDSLYGDYCKALVKDNFRPALIAHYYSFILAHVVGGGLSIAKTASGELPSGWLDQSLYYNIPGSRTLRQQIVDEIIGESTYWTEKDEQACLEEVDVAFRFAMLLLHQ